MKIGIVSFTDGRKRVADSLNDACHGFQGDIAKWLKRKGHQVVEGMKIIWNYAAVRSEATRMNRAGCDVVVFNFSVWSFPDLTVQTASLIEAPILCIGNLNPGQPGWVAFFASAGALDSLSGVRGAMENVPWICQQSQASGIQYSRPFAGTTPSKHPGRTTPS